MRTLIRKTRQHGFTVVMATTAEVGEQKRVRNEAKALWTAHARDQDDDKELTARLPRLQER